MLRLDVSGIVKAVAEIDDGVERDETLRVEHGAHAVGNELMHTLAFGADLHRTGEKLDELILGDFGLFGRRQGDFFERRSTRVERLYRRVNLAPRLQNLLKRGVEIFATNFALTCMEEKCWPRWSSGCTPTRAASR